MIEHGFLSEHDRQALVAWVQDGAAASRVTRRAKAFLLVDGGMSCQEVADGLLFDNDAIRGWMRLFEQRGLKGMTCFELGGSVGFLSAAQEQQLKVWVAQTLPRTRHQIGAWIETTFQIVYESRSGLIALLHCLRLEYHKPLETGQTRMIEVHTVAANSTIRLLNSIEMMYPLFIVIHIILDNARHYHAKIVNDWLERPGCRIKLHFMPTDCPPLNPIERLLGVMHRNVTHNKSYETCAQFADATLSFPEA